MTKKSDDKLQEMRSLCDAKVRPHLEQFAPVWLVQENVVLDEDSLLFNAVFCHPQYGWISRRYRYDAFNDVLYHKGQNRITEDEALELERETPYINAETINTVNSYGG